MQTEKKVWYQPTDCKPKDGEVIVFKDDNNVEHHGIFIEKEDMFFIGYEDCGEFRFSNQVEFWRYLTKDESAEFVIKQTLDLIEHTLNQYFLTKIYQNKDNEEEVDEESESKEQWLISFDYLNKAFLMSFDTQNEQIKWVNKLSKSVENINYTLNSCIPISIEKWKQIKKSNKNS